MNVVPLGESVCAYMHVRGENQTVKLTFEVLELQVTRWCWTQAITTTSDLYLKEIISNVTQFDGNLRTAQKNEHESKYNDMEGPKRPTAQCNVIA